MNKSLEERDSHTVNGTTSSEKNSWSSATLNSQPPSPPQTLYSRTRAQNYALSNSTADTRMHAMSPPKEKRNTQRFPRISRPVELLRPSYDVVVIGSGYGGGVAASRMARAGQSVCVLERGKERWPGEYPSSSLSCMADLHISGSSKFAGIGDPTGLYHMVVGEGQSAVVGNGLGGTSLINSNIFLRADEGTMSLSDWPEELRETKALDPYYELAEDMLQPEPYPENWPELPKLKLLEKQANALGMGHKFRRVPQTTRFANGTNSTGVEMNASTLSGQDCTGVNDGSKSSTLVNYLADAWNWGAEMFCESEVRYVKKRPQGDGYLVFFAWHGSGRGAFKNNLYEDLMWVHAKDCVFLGAGTLGTTEILLRSQQHGLSLSSRIGTGMSGNGDVMAVAYNCDENVNSVGSDRPNPYRPVGPTITGVIDCREGHANPLDGFVIQEGAIPQMFSSLFQAFIELMPNQQVSPHIGLYRRLSSLAARVGSHVLGPYLRMGSIQKTQIFLVMSHDANQAVLTLRKDKPHLKFLGVGRSNHAKKIRNLLAKAAMAVGGTFVDNPIHLLQGNPELTVHPIGGACMSSDGTSESGVTNHFGEVLTGHGESVHRGLVVTDAAVIPTALGVNPFATIAALAERSVRLTAAKMGIEIDYETRNGTLNLFGSPKISIGSDKSFLDAEALIDEAAAANSSGISFSEVMVGHIHADNNLDENKRENYEGDAAIGRGHGEAARFFLSVKAPNTDTLVRGSDHSALLTGSFTCATIPGSPFMVQRGKFHLFSSDAQTSGTKNLVYDFDMTGVNGEFYHFHGYKVVDASVTLNPIAFWKATSTLYVTITTTDGNTVARGMLHVQPRDFVSQSTTIIPSGPNLLSKSRSLVGFFSYFVRESAGLVLTPFTKLEFPLNYSHGFINPTPASETIRITASDGVISILRMWEACPSDPNLEIHDLFMIPGASVDHQIFALPTIKHNAVNYFTKAGYRVWVLVHRIGMSPEEKKTWTGFDTRLDIRAALEYIRKVQGPQKIYTIAHCVGAMAFSSGLLDGTIPASWIKGITCSQAFMNLALRPLNAAKVSINAISLYKLLAGNYMSFSSSTNDSFIQKLLNQLLRLYPDPPSEMCTNVACHRTSLAFGRLWTHRNLNEATHRSIHRFFGGVNMTLLGAISTQGVNGHVATNAPVAEDLVTSERIQNLEGIPIFFFSGSENMAWSPESTYQSYAQLRNTFGPEGYEREVVEGYGHLDCWMGTRSFVDVYPMVRKRVDRICRGKEYKFTGGGVKNSGKDKGV